MKHALHKAKVAAQKAKVASKYQQTQPKSRAATSAAAARLRW